MSAVLKTKQQVDKHASSILNRISDAKERKLKSYNVAVLYYRVKDYVSANKYLSMYMSVRDDSAPAHKLMGQICEAIGNKQQAIASYKRSLELDDKQRDVVLNICRLYCETDIDPERARYWADRAESLFPSNDTVFRLRERILQAGGDANTAELEKLLAAELVKRPKDVQLRIQLVNHMMESDNHQLQEAFNHVCSVEATGAYCESLEWYTFLADMLKTYEDRVGPDEQYYITALQVLCSLMELSLQRRDATECSSVLYRLDQTLFNALRFNKKSEEFEVFLTEIQAQAFYHAGTLLLKRAQKRNYSWKEATPYAAACYLISQSYGPALLQCTWHTNATEQQKKTHQQWNGMANNRLCQAGYMVISFCQGNPSKWISDIKESHCNKQCQAKLYSMLFVRKDLLRGKETSFLSSTTKFTNCLVQYPSRRQLSTYEKVAITYKPASLHHIVWMALQHYSVRDPTQPNYGFDLFKENIRYSVSNADTSVLCQLDVHAFLYATVRCTAVRQEDKLKIVPLEESQPFIVPESISDTLCTAEQAEWWTMAYRMHYNVIKENFSKARLIYQRGLETVRMMASHGMDVQLVVHVAKTFEERCAEATSETDASNLQARAGLYWTKAMEMLENLSKDRPMRYPKERLFKSDEPDIDTHQIDKLVNEGKFYLACEHMNSGSNEEAINNFKELKTPDASYYQAKIYRRLAESEIQDLSQGDLTAIVGEKYRSLLLNARDALYLTLDRLRGSRTHPLNSVLHSDIEDVEMKISRADNDEIFSFVDAVDGSQAEQNISRPGQIPLAYSTPQKTLQQEHSFRTFNGATSHYHIERPQDSLHLKPSPERLDAQIRALTRSHEAILQAMTDNNALVQTNKEIVEELRRTCRVVEQLSTKLERFMETQQHMLAGVTPASAGLHGAGVQYQPPVPGYPSPFAAPSPMQGAPGLIAGYGMVPGTVPAFQGLPQQPVFPQQAGLPAPVLPVHQAVPSGGVEFGMRSTCTPQAAGGASQSADHDENYDYDENEDYEQYTEEEEEYENKYQVPDSELVHTWPYGNSTEVQGKATICYSPQKLITTRPMPQPGFFSTPPRPTAPGDLPPLRPEYCSQGGESNKVPPPNVVLGTPIGSMGSDSSLIPGIDGTTKFKLSMPAGSSTNTMTASTSAPALPAIMVPKASHVGMGKQMSTSESNDNRGGPLTPKSPGGAESETEHDVSYDGPHFEPIIPLPDKVDARTGEEDEKTLFEERAKLYRWFENQWKERGTGGLKLLHNELMGKVRLVMRRDQVLKICANHNITADLDLQPGSQPDRTWMWCAMDFTENEGQPERFCVRFKTEEIAQKFKQEVEKSKDIVKQGATGKLNNKPEKTEETAAAAASENLLEKFKPKPDSWNCEICYVNNPGDKTACLACQTTRPGCKPEPEKEIANAPRVTIGAGGFNFAPSKAQDNKQEVAKETVAATEDFSAKFKPKPGSWDCEICYVNNPSDKTVCLACQTTKPGCEPEPEKLIANAPSLTIGTGGFKFGNLPTATSVQGSITSGTPSSTSSPKPGKGFVFVASSQGKPAEVTSTTNDNGKPNLTGVSKGFVFGGTQSSTVPPAVPTSTQQKPVLSPPKLNAASSGFTFTFGQKPESPISASGDKDKTAEFPKSVFGGFTFKSTPVVAEPKIEKPTVAKEEKIKEDPPKPFAGFSFTPTKAEDSTSSTKSVFGNKSSFSTLAENKEGNFAKSEDFKDFTSAGPQVSTPVKQGGDEDTDDDHDTSGYEPDADFKPVVTLPELIKVQTGEEDEEKLLSERAKLYRYDADSSQWKERGTGEIKILSHVTKTQFRILMRREQVLKLCANHLISPTMKLSPLQTSDRAWCWFAMDYSEDDMKEEKFCVRFKTAEIALEFKNVFEKCVEKMKNKPLDTKEKTEADKASEGSQQVKTEQTSLAEMFKPEVGSWECNACYIRNDGESFKCAACNTPRPGYEDKAAKSSPFKDIGASENSQGFKFESGSGFAFTSSSAAPSQGSQSIFGGTTKTDEQSSSGFKFSIPASSASANIFGGASTEVTSTSSSEGFKFGSGFNFGSKATISSSINDAQASSEVSSSTNDEDSEDDVIFVRKLLPSEEKIALAQKYRLPDTFYNYEECKPCPGCIGCEDYDATRHKTVTVQEQVPAEITSSSDSASDDKQSAIHFGNASVSDFSFSALAQTGDTGFFAKKDSSKPFSWSGAGASLFGASPNKGDNDDDDGEVEVSNDPHFEAIIPLPELVQIRTGEEDEKEIFRYRAKLFRYEKSVEQWKERGIGEMKILYNEQSGNYRLLLRREQVLKVACNHNITPDMKLSPMATSETAWCWLAIDFAEPTEEPVPHQFAVRFKTIETSNAFKEAFERCQQALRDQVSHPSE